MGELIIPRGWCAATFAVWGAATGQWLTAVVAALFVELAQWTPWRWDLTTRHFERLADLTTLGFAGLTIYQFSERGLFGIYAILGAFPLCLLPLLIAQQYSASGRIPLSAFVMASRRAKTTPRVDLRPICGCTCLLAAATGDLSPQWYGCGIAVGLIALVSANRAARYPSARFGMLLGGVLLLAWGGYRGLLWTQYGISDLMQAMITQIGWVPADPDRNFTALGMLGRLKLSDRIVLRVATPRNIPLPLRLVEARYQIFQNGIWRNEALPLTTIDPAPASPHWIVEQTNGAIRRLEITAERQRELGALALPAGTTTLTGADVIELQRQALGTIVAEARPGFLRYAAEYLITPELTATPLPADLEVPASYRAALTAISREIGPRGQTPNVARRQLKQFFANNFRYSLVQRGFFPGRTPLLTFLRDTRHGHCEYFASATTLLLRVLGIPARYVVGYMVDEYSPLEGMFVARARHAHAWSEAYIDGSWQVVDTTPGLWLEEEAGRAGWHWLSDLWQWQRWHLQRLRRGDYEVSPWLATMVLPLAAWLAWRLRGLSRRQSRAIAPTALPPSELTRLYEHLAKRGVRPAVGETTARFLLRHWSPAHRAVIRRVIDLHYQWRFRPGGISDSAHAQLRVSVSALLQESRG